jgi:octaprenyl-diphosphate synthase
MNTGALNAKSKSHCPKWTLPVANELVRVQETIESVTNSSVEIATQISSYVLAAGGKRIRPCLVLLSVGACGGEVNAERVIRMAAAAELIHTASLLHDDVIDSAGARRGVCTANALWGNTLSVLGGDFLLSKAFYLLGDLVESEIISLLSNAAVAMTESELLQTSCENNIDSWRSEYWHIIRGKTASLISACCESGAILSQASKDAQLALRNYGESLGLAFQITDDLLDIIGNPAQTGKQVGSDLINGKFTLPVLIASTHDSFPFRFLTGEKISPELAQQIAKFVVECGAAEEAKRIAEKIAQHACQSLAVLEDSTYRQALELLATSVVVREF